MAGETHITVVGNVGGDPELRFTASGKAKIAFSVGSSTRTLNKATNEWENGPTTWFNVIGWDRLAENTAESIGKGDRVIVQGRFVQRSYENREGEKRTVYELIADEIAPSLRNATAKVTRATRASNGGGPGRPAPPDDPWATAPAGAPSANSGNFSDDPPF